MSQKKKSLWANRPMLLGVLIASSLATSGVIAFYLLTDAPPATLAAPLAQSPQVANQPAVETLSFMERGNRASALGELFSPAGANALEYFIQARDRQEAGAAQAMLELLPTALMQFDTEIDRQTLDQAQQLLDLIQRADPKSPVLASLQAKLQAATQNAQLAASQALAPAIREVVPTASIAAPAAASAPEAGMVTSVAPSGARNGLSPSTPAVVEESQPVTTPVPTSTQALAQTVAPAATAPPTVKTIAVPRLIAAPAPLYPANAKRSRMEGWVELKLTVNANGGVADAEVVQSEPSGIFDMAAKRAAKRYRFEAGLENAVVRHRVQFKISG